MPLLDCQISEFIDSPEFRLEPSMTQLALLRRALEITPPYRVDAVVDVS
jgi:hypothetical protein